MFAQATSWLRGHAHYRGSGTVDRTMKTRLTTVTVKLEGISFVWSDGLRLTTKADEVLIISPSGKMYTIEEAIAALEYKKG